jgi:hypothetical protein
MLSESQPLSIGIFLIVTTSSAMTYHVWVANNSCASVFDWQGLVHVISNINLMRCIPLEPFLHGRGACQDQSIHP